MRRVGRATLARGGTTQFERNDNLRVGDQAKLVFLQVRVNLLVHERQYHGDELGLHRRSPHLSKEGMVGCAVCVCVCRSFVLVARVTKEPLGRLR